MGRGRLKNSALRLVEPESLAPLSLSEQMWDLRWSEHFPYVLDDVQISIEVGSFLEAENFLAANFATIYQQTEKKSGFIARETPASKRRFYEGAGDIFLFKKHDKIVGIFASNPTDWSSYYLRNASFLPDLQGKGIYQRFLVHLLGVLSRHRVERVTGDVSPAHLSHIHILQKLGFTITGNDLSERWGAMLKFTLFLSDPHRRVFLDQFCWGTKTLGAKRPK